jgi:hypothetical protein
MIEFSSGAVSELREQQSRSQAHRSEVGGPRLGHTSSDVAHGREFQRQAIQLMRSVLVSRCLAVLNTNFQQWLQMLLVVLWAQMWAHMDDPWGTNCYFGWWEDRHHAAEQPSPDGHPLETYAPYSSIAKCCPFGHDSKADMERWQEK